MKRITVQEPAVFDILHRGVTLRVRVDHDGVKLWKRTQGNLDAPKRLDRFISMSWKRIGEYGYCYHGTKKGIPVEKGPALSRGGLRYLFKESSPKDTEERPTQNTIAVSLPKDP